MIQKYSFVRVRASMYLHMVTGIQDNVLNYMHHEVESFTWQDDNKLYIDVK